MTKVSRNESQLKSLSTLRLPTLPAGTTFLLESLTDENIEFIELAAIIENFPSITAKLISLANSVWSAPASEITSIETTCSRLGFSVVRSTSIALAIATPFNPLKCQQFDPEYFWCSASLTAEAASRLVTISRIESDLEPSTARAAGLLHNLGLLWLVDRLPTEVNQALTMVKNNQTDTLQQALIDLLGFDQAQAGGHLGNNWDLPEPLVAAMTHCLQRDYQGPQNAIVTIVGLAARLVSANLKEQPCPNYDLLPPSLEIAEKDFHELFEQMKGQVAKIQAIAKVLV